VNRTATAIDGLFAQLPILLAYNVNVDTNVNAKDKIKKSSITSGTSRFTKKQNANLEPFEISYTMIRSGQLPIEDILQELATAINVQLSRHEQQFPFVSPDNFERCTTYADKILFFGISGCGKSRAIFEVIKGKTKSFEKIYIINPRNPVGEESGRVNLCELVNRFEENDIIVWDNFPDDLVKRDIDNAQTVLELISSKNVRQLLIALKPKYLELYRGILYKPPEVYAYEIIYNKNNIKDIVKLYGTTLVQFREVYEKYIAKDLDKISNILWQKEPTPLTVIDYYKELNDKSLLVIRAKAVNEGKERKQQPKIINAIQEAEKLLRRTEYNEHQFGFIANSKERQSEAEFLYTLKLCYELGLNRTASTIEQLQNGIFSSSNFASSNKDPSVSLGSWLYLSGIYYSMHDVPKESISFPDYVKLKIMRYLEASFAKITSNAKDSQINSIGLFFGRNIEFIQIDMEKHQSLPVQIVDYMKSKRYFETALGQGIGEIFLSLDSELQQAIMKTVETSVEFARGMVNGLGQNFPTLEKKRQQEILDTIKMGYALARFFGESVGQNFKFLSNELQNNIFEISEVNPQFADGLGMGLGYIYGTLDNWLQQKILQRAEKNSELTRGLGYGLANGFEHLTKEIQENVLTHMLQENSQIAMGLGMGFGYKFPVLPEGPQQEILKKVEENHEFAFGFAMSCGLALFPLTEDQQKKNFELAKVNPQFDLGLGLGFGYSFQYVPRELWKQYFERAKKNTWFAYGFGMGLSHSITSLSNDLRNEILEYIKTNGKMADGLGYGFGFIFLLLSKSFHDLVFEMMEKYSEFARGIGYGLGLLLKFLPRGLQQEVFERARKNIQFSTGLGISIGRLFPYIPKEFHETIFELTKTYSGCSYGLGIGFVRVLRFLPRGLQQEVFERARKDIQFSTGLGQGFGYIFNCLPGLQQDTIKRLIIEDSGFARGFGIGIGTSF
jgi:hypothetical protein